MTVLVTDEVPDNVERIFSTFSNFNCVVVPRDKLYKMQQARYPTFKWITETNPTTVIYKIRDYLNRYNYINEMPMAQYSPKYQPSTSPPRGINILVRE